MPKPTPGRPYTVQQGDNLSRISNAAYGTPREWRRIWKANKTVLKSDDPNLIFPGEVINIPGDAPLEEVKKIVRPETPTLPDKAPDDFTLLVDGVEIPVANGRVFRSFDAVSDGFAATIAWDNTNPELEEIRAVLRPYLYNDFALYLAGEQIMAGRIYTLTPTIEQGAVSLQIEGWSYTADLVDSTIRPPYEATGINFETRIKDVIEGFALNLDFQLDSDPQFERLTIEPSETVFGHLVKLAKQRKAVLTSDVFGQLVVTQANADGESVYTLEEGQRPFNRATVKFDGRARFNTYNAISDAPRKKRRKPKPYEATAKDGAVPTARMTRFNAPEATEGTIQDIANWERSQRVSASLTMNIPVDGWQIPGTDQLWRENEIVTMQSPSLFVPDGFSFLIRSVEFAFDAGGATTNLELIPPQAFTGEPIEEPWGEEGFNAAVSSSEFGMDPFA